uniref:Uncharacterized protein n=1 Tax=Cyclopterus lumpus TaxID=8103 RepID=A0A8C2Z293_CYCLU
MSETDREAATELTAAVTCTCRQIVVFPFTSALDEMGTRIHGLEKNVSELTTQAVRLRRKPAKTKTLASTSVYLLRPKLF